MANGKKPRANGTMTESQFRTMLTASMRRLTKYWPPTKAALKKSDKTRTQFYCSGCDSILPKNVLDPKTGKQKSNRRVDHINPIVDPEKGWQGFDSWVERTFVEVEGLQVLCIECHDAKTAEENAIRKKVAAKKRAEEKARQEREGKGEKHVFQKGYDVKRDRRKLYDKYQTDLFGITMENPHDK